MTYSPCHHCQDRHVGCHNPEICIRWAVACRINKDATESKQKKSDRDVSGYLCNAKKRICRSLRHRNVNGK
jgi:hypothetical protein